MNLKIFSILFVSVFGATLGTGIIVPFLPLYAQTYGATGFEIGMIFSAFAFTRSLFLPFIGKISDKKGRKIFITFGLFLFTILSLLYTYAPNVLSLIIIRAFHGISSACIIPIALAYVGDIVPEGKEGHYMGIFNISLFGGLAVGPLLGGVIKDIWGIKESFMIMGMVTCTAFLLSLFFLPEKKKISKISISPHVSYRELLKNKMIQGITLFRFLVGFGIALIWAFLPLYAGNIIHLSSSKIGSLIFTSIFLTAILQHPMGKLADKVNRRYMVIVGGILSSIGMFIIPFAYRYLFLFFAVTIQGISRAILLPALTALSVVEGRREKGMGSTMSLVIFAHSTGMMIAPVTAGILTDLFGLNFVFFIGSFFAIVGVAFFYFITKRRVKVLTI